MRYVVWRPSSGATTAWVSGIRDSPRTPAAISATPNSWGGSHLPGRHACHAGWLPPALLDLVVRLGRLLRRRDQAARALTLTLTFVGNSIWEKTRRLAEPSAHDDDLRLLAYQLMDAAGLQRGRLTALALKGEDLGEDLIAADRIAEQLSFGDAREARLVAEAAVDRVRDKFGPGVIGPAAVFRPAS